VKSAPGVPPGVSFSTSTSARLCPAFRRTASSKPSPLPIQGLTIGSVNQPPAQVCYNYADRENHTDENTGGSRRMEWRGSAVRSSAG